MRFTVGVAGGALALAATALANSDLCDFGNIPADHVLFGADGGLCGPTPTQPVKRQATSSTASSSTSLVPDSACTNGPDTRACWSNGFSIATDFDSKWPTTGRTRTYDWHITNTTCNPDGQGEKVCMLVENQYPGPTLEAGKHM